MVTETEKRWPNYHSEIPNRMGVIEDIEKFDATFFGVRYIHWYPIFLFGENSYFFFVEMAGAVQANKYNRSAVSFAHWDGVWSNFGCGGLPKND